MGAYDRKTPCKGCTKRQIEPVNCHSYCEDYLALQERRSKIKEAKDEERKKNYTWSVAKRRTVKRSQR